ncbi:MAG: methyltransferase domain-containing protein [Pseudomonadales bacterium]|nr:methyltransferase domain-containing protein [Pseudomonadales bacterium]
MNDLSQIDNQQLADSVKNYYGEVLATKADLKTSACCPIDAMPKHLIPLLRNIHPVIQEKFYGCGSPIPHALEGKTVLDLGCGTGRDVYLLSQLVGEKGKVIGIDMTEQQLSVAREYQQYHQDKFNYSHSNVEFHQAYIEDLRSADIADNSIDVVISNCVINLSPEKEQVFKEIFRVLKPGGELYFSDVFSSRRISKTLQQDPVLLGECLGGAMYTEDFRRLLNRLDILDFRATQKGQIELHDEAILQQAGMIDFTSITIRAFKCDFEDICENYGHVAFYKGGIKNSPHAFLLDDHHLFKTGLPVPVCGNTAKMLTETRYSEYFEVIGDFSQHYGVFDCSDDSDNNELNLCC